MNAWSAITWDTARAAGFASYVLLTAAVSVGLVLRNRWQSTRWPRLVTNELHGYLSLLALVFIAVHVVAVLVDPFTRFGLVEVLVPLASHYRPVWMGLGIVALYLLLAVWVSSRLRAHIGFRTWRTIHVLSYGVYGAATVHGLGTGSDTRTVWASVLYASSVILVAVLAGRRLLVPVSRGNEPRPVLALLGGVLVVAIAGLGRLRPAGATLGSACWGDEREQSRCRTARQRPQLAERTGFRGCRSSVRRRVQRTRDDRPCGRDRPGDDSDRRCTPRRLSRSPRDLFAGDAAGGRRRGTRAEPRPHGDGHPLVPGRDRRSPRVAAHRRAPLQDEATAAGDLPEHLRQRPGRRRGSRD